MKFFVEISGFGDDSVYVKSLVYEYLLENYFGHNISNNNGTKLFFAIYPQAEVFNDVKKTYKGVIKVTTDSMDFYGKKVKFSNFFSNKKIKLILLIIWSEDLSLDEVI